MVVKVQGEDFDVGKELAALTEGNWAIGGMTSFVGLVRDLGGADALKAMTLEHYPGMTEKMLREIEAEANERWSLEASLIVHRYGRLEPGDRIVLVATASAHRQAACHRHLPACRAGGLRRRPRHGGPACVFQVSRQERLTKARAAGDVHAQALPGHDGVRVPRARVAPRRDGHQRLRRFERHSRPLANRAALRRRRSG